LLLLSAPTIKADQVNSYCYMYSIAVGLANQFKRKRDHKEFINTCFT